MCTIATRNMKQCRTNKWLLPNHPAPLPRSVLHPLLLCCRPSASTARDNAPHLGRRCLLCGCSHPLELCPQIHSWLYWPTRLQIPYWSFATAFSVWLTFLLILLTMSLVPLRSCTSPAISFKFVAHLSFHVPIHSGLYVLLIACTDFILMSPYCSFW